MEKSEVNDFTDAISLQLIYDIYLKVFTNQTK